MLSFDKFKKGGIFRIAKLNEAMQTPFTTASLLDSEQRNLKEMDTVYTHYLIEHMRCK